jgi:hypothetical protein
MNKVHRNKLIGIIGGMGPDAFQLVKKLLTRYY